MNNTNSRKLHQLDPDWAILWFVFGGAGGLALTGSVWERLIHPFGFALMMSLACGFIAVGFYSIISKHFWKIFFGMLLLLVYIAIGM